MALNAAERAAVARSLLECFQTDVYRLGRFLAFLQVRGGIDLLAACQTEAATWQPYINDGLTISWFQSELTRIRDSELRGLV